MHEGKYMAARKKKAPAKKTAARKTRKTPRKAKAKKASVSKRKTTHKAKKAVAPRRRKVKRKTSSQKATPKNMLKNIDKIKKIRMDDVKDYIANIDVIDKLEELLLSLEQQIARRLQNKKIIRKIT